MRSERSILTSSANLDPELAKYLTKTESDTTGKRPRKEFRWLSQGEPVCLICFSLQTSDGVVVCAIACSPRLESNLELTLNEGILRVKNSQLGFDLNLGDPRRGGTLEYRGTVGLSGRRVGKRSRQRLKTRGLMADPFTTVDLSDTNTDTGGDSNVRKCSIVLIGLQEDPGGDIKVFRIVDFADDDLETERDQLVELILAPLVQAGAI